VLQLYLEHEHIVRERRIRIRPVVIRVEPMSGRWGMWDPAARTITLSTQLIERYSWDVVVEVLKHEIAHQIVSEIFGRSSPHGPAFSQAADLLGLAPWARSASGELPHEVPHWKQGAVSKEEERLLQKVEKLLALAGSANENEALAAMARVRELYAKHNLERLRDRRAPEMVSLVVELKKRRIEREESKIASILIEHFFVRIVFGSLFDAKELEHHRTVEILGARENVLMAEYVRAFLHERSQALWQQHRQKTGAPGRSRRSYVFGVLSGFATKLARERTRSASEVLEGVSAEDCRALMRSGDRKLDEFVASRYPRLSSRRANAWAADGESFAAGRREGERLTLHRPVEDQATSRGLALGSGAKR
jgi:hypothetical protein